MRKCGEAVIVGPTLRTSSRRRVISQVWTVRLVNCCDAVWPIDDDDIAHGEPPFTCRHLLSRPRAISLVQKICSVTACRRLLDSAARESALIHPKNSRCVGTLHNRCTARADTAQSLQIAERNLREEALLPLLCVVLPRTLPHLMRRDLIAKGDGSVRPHHPNLGGSRQRRQRSRYRKHP
jgi:hypothetical protein